MPMKTKHQICFVGHNAYGALTGQNLGHAGGIEQQLALLSRSLVKKGYSVALITWDHGQQDGELIDGVTCYKMSTRDAGLPGLRFLPRWFSLTRALARADAECYFYSCGDVCLGQIVMWARRQRRKTLFSVANEVDCLAALPSMPEFRERLFFRFGLKHVDDIITQTVRQQELLASEHGLSSFTIPMPSYGYAPVIRDHVGKEGRRRVLWIGRFSAEKRLEWLFELARQCPEIDFDVIGDANMPTEYAQRLHADAKALANVVLHGRVAHAELEKFHHAAFAYCSTSVYEGFPNVFLEAWSTGLPIVSTFDPDNVIRRHDLGHVVGSVEGLVKAFRSMLEDREAYLQQSQAARNYFLENHAVDKVIPQYQAHIDGLLSR